MPRPNDGRQCTRAPRAAEQTTPPREGARATSCMQYSRARVAYHIWGQLPGAFHTPSLGSLSAESQARRALRFQAVRGQAQPLTGRPRTASFKVCPGFRRGEWETVSRRPRRALRSVTDNSKRVTANARRPHQSRLTNLLPYGRHRRSCLRTDFHSRGWGLW